MDKRYLDFTEMYHTNSMNNMSNKFMYNTKIDMPTCVNDNFCEVRSQNTDGVLTMAFVNMQPLDGVYSPEMALSNGTLFPNVNKPFMGGRYK